jgi:hypothetical protein
VLRLGSGAVEVDCKKHGGSLMKIENSVPLSAIPNFGIADSEYSE